MAPSMFHMFDSYTDIQGTSATSGDGLYEGLTWLQQELTGKQMKKTVTKPIQETKDSIMKSGFVSSWLSALGNYFTFTTTAGAES